MKNADAIIATRAFLRGSLITIKRIDTQLVDAALLHAGDDLVHTEDHLNAAIVLTGQLLSTLTQAQTCLAVEQQKAAA